MTSLEDKDTIRELLHRYCFCMDEGRFGELAALFAEAGLAPRGEELRRREQGGRHRPRRQAGHVEVSGQHRCGHGSPGCRSRWRCRPR